MQVIFESSDPQAPELRALAERRVRQVLKRLAWMAPRVRVHLSDVNGPRGGIDKRCQVEVSSSVAGPVLITSMAHDWRAALQTALAATARVLLKNLQRSRMQRRTALAAATF